MISSPLVSVVVSTFDRCHVLKGALEALLHQSGVSEIPYEILVIDNNSSDSTSQLLEQLRASHPDRLSHLFEAKQGVSHGRNTGIDAARAPIVAFTDDDNVVAPDWIATIKRLMDRSPDVAAVGGKILPAWPGPVPDWLDARHWSPLALLDYGDRPFLTSADMPWCLLTANLAVRRSLFVKIGKFSPALLRCQDHEFLLRLWRAGERALYAPELVVSATVSPERLTKRYHSKWHREHGFYTASMQLQESIDAHGRLLGRPVDAARLCGSPGFVYAELLCEVGRWMRAAATKSAAQSLHHKHRVQYFVTYLRRNAAHRRAHRGLCGALWAFGRAHLERYAAEASMCARRMALAAVLIACLGAGSLYDIVTGREHWPFSPYPMFAAIDQNRTLSVLRLVGVTAEDTPREIPLLDSRLIAPFDQCRLSTALSRTYFSARRPLIHEMLRDSLERYDALRIAGEHDQPPLGAVRLYEMRWTLDPAGRNVATPDERHLIEEVHRGRGPHPNL